MCHIAQILIIFVVSLLLKVTKFQERVMKNKQRQQPVKAIINKPINAILDDDLELDSYPVQKIDNVQIGSGEFKEKIKKGQKRVWY
jgi:hypothetical protein